MRKKILNALFGILFIGLVAFSSYVVTATGNPDYNKTLYYELVDSLSGSNRFAIVNLDKKSNKYKDFHAFSNPYNEDFLFYSALVRVSSLTLELSNGSNDSTSITISDFQTSNIYNKDVRYNHSLLTVNKDITTFENNSIILSETVMSSLSISTGDNVTLKINDKSVELIVAGSYSSGGKYINDFYYEVSENVCFTDYTVFEQLVEDNYFGYLAISNPDDKYRNAYWNELLPVIKESRITLSINDKYTFNSDLEIKGLGVLEYQKQLANRYSRVKSNNSYLFLKIILAIGAVTEFIALCLFVRDSVVFYKKRKIIFCSIYSVVVVGIGLVAAKLGPMVIALLDKSDLYFTYITSLQVLFFAVLAMIVVPLFYGFYNLFYEEFLETYNKTRLKINDIINVSLNTDSGIANLELANQEIQDNSVLIFGSFVAPDKSAGAIRVINHAKMLNKGSYNVYISSYLDNYDGASIYKYSERIFFTPLSNNPITKRQKLHLYLNPRKEVERVLNKFNENKPKAIIIYSVFPLTGISTIRKFCKKNKVKLIFDVVESHSISQQSFSSFFATYLQNKIMNNLVIKKNDNVIAISSYLADKFIRKHCKVCRIPLINDINDFKFSLDVNSGIKHSPTEKIFVYVGNPGRGKDLLSPVIKAFAELQPANAKLIIVGVDVDKLIINERLKKDALFGSAKNVVVLGKISHREIESIYGVADYSILIRNPKRESAKAGFPTKISESLAYGVPVIANSFSDLNLVLDDGNSIIVSDNTVNSIKRSIQEAISISDHEYENKRVKARETAVNKLSLSCYDESLLEFIAKD